MQSPTSREKSSISPSLPFRKVGGILANVNRWLGQVGIEPTNESGLSAF